MSVSQKLIERLKHNFNRNVNWRYRKKEIIAYLVKTFAIFSAIFILSMMAGFTSILLSSLLFGVIIFQKTKKEGKDELSCLVFALISALILSLFVRGLAFAAIMIIVFGLPVYFYEEYTRPYDTLNDRPQKHPFSPYPKVPLFVGMFIFLFCAIESVNSLSAIPAEIMGSGEKSDISQLEIGDKIPLEDKNIFESWLSSFLSAWNWLTFCVVLSLYALPKKILEFFSDIFYRLRGR